MLRVSIASLLFILCALTSPLRSGVHEKPSSSPDVLKDVLWWFPEDTETLMIARGPFKAEALEQDAPPKDLAQFFRRISFGPLMVMQDGKFYEQIQGQTILLAVEGSRRFRSPAALGVMLYEGCTAIYFESSFASIKESFVKSLRANSQTVQDINGYQVIGFEERWESNLWKLYVTFPEENLLLCATDEGYLKETLSRMNHRSTKRGIPQDLPEWEYVDTQAQFWGIRHYSQKGFTRDPSSPLSGVKRAYNIPDKEATGLAYSFDPGSRKELRIKYLSTNKDAVSLAKEYWDPRNYKLEPEISRSKSGVDITFDSEKFRPYSILQLMILGAFGHGLYI